MEEAVSQTGVGRNTVEPDLQLAPRDCVASLAENTHPSALEDVSSGTRMCLHGHSVSGQGQTPASQIRLAAGDNAVDTTGPGGPIAESAAATTRRSKVSVLVAALPSPVLDIDDLLRLRIALF